MFRVLRYLSVVAALLLMASCTQGRVEYPAEFALADSLATFGEANRSVNILEEISSKISTFTETERHRYDLLCIKAADKADMPLPYDSLILDVIAYYEKHTELGQLPEAYYYGGRIFVTMGDIPHALEYYQKASEAAAPLPNNQSSLRLKGNIYSNIAQLFHIVDCDSLGVPYIHRTLECDALMGDSSLMVYEYRDLGYAAWEYNQLDSVEIYFNKARDIAAQIHDTVQYSMMQAQFAGYYCVLQRYDSIKPFLPHLWHPLDGNYSSAHSILADYYYAIGLLDSAKVYYQQLLDYGTIYAKAKANMYLAEISLSNKDYSNILSYAKAYIELSDSINGIKNSEKAQQMEASYNYSLREKENERLASEIRFYELVQVITFIFFIILIVGVFMAIKYYSNKRKLSDTLRQQAEYKAWLIGKNFEDLENKSKAKLEDSHNRIKALEESIIKMREDFLLYKNNIKIEEEYLRKTDIYSQIKDKITRNKALDEQDLAEMESQIIKVNPIFIQKILCFCTDDKDKKLCLLLKYRIKPAGIASLLCASRSNISKRRTVLAEKVFGAQTDMTPKDFDRYIEYL